MLQVAGSIEFFVYVLERIEIDSSARLSAYSNPSFSSFLQRSVECLFYNYFVLSPINNWNKCLGQPISMDHSAS